MRASTLSPLFSKNFPTGHEAGPRLECVMRQFYFTFGLLLLLATAGCAGSLLRYAGMGDVAETPPEEETESTRPEMVSDLARPHGMNFVQVEAVSLVTRLDGTGADPAQTPQRASLLSEMKRREIANPSEILASNDTALVLVRGLLRPGIQKGDRFDVEVRVPSRSEVKSLRGGWLLPTRLTELAVLDRQIRTGHMLATVEGPVLVDPAADETDTASLTRGRILGKAVAQKSRPLGLAIDHEHQSFHTSQLIGAMINRRFQLFTNGTQRGVANSKTDEFVELTLHPRYKDNVHRYMQVIRNIALHDGPVQRVERLELLRGQLQDPLTAAKAAIRLEAIGGDDARAALKEAITSQDIEVRFYAAEALAYLDDSAAAETLANAARDEPAFRLNALAALSALDDPLSREALKSLLDVKSAETRYGAFRALWSMDQHDPTVEGESIHDEFSFHLVPTGGPSLIHATRSFRPEIVLFGAGHTLRTPLLIEAGNNIVVQGTNGTELTVASFEKNEPTQKRVISNSVEEVVRTIVEVGGTYPDVVQALQEANAAGVLSSRFRVDALPTPDREFDRVAVKSDDTPSDAAVRRIETPRSEMFGDDVK